MNGELYAIGVGPGDPELITLKAVRVLKSADVVVVPRTKDRAQSHAYEIAKEHLGNQCELIYQIFPMNFNQDELSSSWQKNADEIMLHLDQNKIVVFLTIGDPMIYSTFIYIYEIIQKMNYKINIVPGIPSFCDVAARTGVPLCKADEVLRIFPVSNSLEYIDEALKSSDNLVLMKVYRHYNDLVEKLGKEKRINSSVLVAKAGMSDEVIVTDLQNAARDDINYLSTIISKKAR